MSIFKCKMCGGELQINPGESVAVCEYCGTTQTLPKLDDDRRANLYDRANHFRRNNDFDKAAGIYEQILNEDKTDAEAYWSLVLCRYGIEYVEDPATHKRVPTVNRAQYTSIFDDEDYKAAIQYADAAQRVVYEAEAKAINEIQKGILEISQKEEPFDVFICYKETDANGRRTPDSVLATDLYHQLTQEGFKVFFSRITLEDKLGTAYEPYIFAALNSAKVMVVLGTKPEYFNAVWVKNEWSRYLALIRGGAKKLLIPAYRDMDPYDLPEEFSHLQAQDMSKLGFMQDLIRGIKKIAQADTPKATVVKETVISGGNANTAPLLKRAFMFLEDGDWNSADEYCEKVLDIDPENASAYLGKLLSELRVRKQESLKDQAEPFADNNNYQKAIRFADDKLKNELIGYIEHINTRNENARLDDIYTRAKNAMSVAHAESDYKEAAHLFESIDEYQDSAVLAQTCYEQAEMARKDTILSEGKSKMTGEAIFYYEAAIKLFESISGWKDADEKVYACQKKIEEIKAKQEADRLERERKAEEERKAAERRAKRNKKIAIITTPIVCVVIAFIIVLNAVIIPNSKYNDAVALMDAGNSDEAYSIFQELGNYRDSAEKAENIRYNDAVSLLEAEDYEMAAIEFGKLGDYSDAAEQSRSLWDRIAAREVISAGDAHTVGLRADGTVAAVGGNWSGQCDVSDWTDIVAIAAGSGHTVGLRADGTVVAVGRSDDGQCDVSGWTDIVAITAGGDHTVGLRADGTVVAGGYNSSGQCDVSDWTDIVAITAGKWCTVGLRSGGTVVAVGKRGNGQCDVSDWTDIVAIAAGAAYTVGLRADGTVAAVGDNLYGRCDVSDWTDIVAIAAGAALTVGLRADGTVVAVGMSDDGQCDVSDWTDIAIPAQVR